MPSRGRVPGEIEFDRVSRGVEDGIDAARDQEAVDFHGRGATGYHGCRMSAGIPIV